MSAVDPGLCASCVHEKTVRSRRGSTFHMCTAPEMPKYPSLPVRTCAAYVPRDDGDEPRS